MKILILSNNLDPKNGWGRYTSDLISGFRQTGLNILVLKELEDGFEGKAILRRGSSILLSALRAIKYARQADVIHAVDVYPFGIIAWLVNIFIRKPYVISLLGTYSVAPFYNSRTRWLSKKACSKAAKLIAISSYTNKEFKKVSGISSATVINPGINFAKFYAARNYFLENQIISVGALKHRKGYHIAIPAFALAKKKVPGLKYTIVGDQSDVGYFEHLKKLAKNLNVDRDIEFIQKISENELKDLYSKDSLFLLPSINHDHHFEGFGLVFLEAAAAGLPVIGTSGNGIEDAVKDGYNGILINQNNVENTADAIVDILSNESEWIAMSKNSYEWARGHDMDLMIEPYLDIYKKI